MNSKIRHPLANLAIDSVEMQLFVPPANGVAKVVFSVVSVYHSVCPQGGGQSPLSRALAPLCTGLPTAAPSVLGPSLGLQNLFNLDLHYTGSQLSLDIFTLVLYEAWSVGKQVVGIQLKCFLVWFVFFSYTQGSSIHNNGECFIL